MAGGSYTDMNKVRPGVYYKRLIDDKIPATSLPQSTLCYIVPLRWGRPITRITLDDYTRNRVYQKCGLANNDDRIQIFSQYCQELVLANPLSGGKAAEAVIRDAVGTTETVTADVSSGSVDETLASGAELTAVDGIYTTTLSILGIMGTSVSVEGDLIAVTGAPEGLEMTSCDATAITMRDGSTETPLTVDDVADILFDSDTGTFHVSFVSGTTPEQVADIHTIRLSVGGTVHVTDPSTTVLSIDADGHMTSSVDTWESLEYTYSVASVEGLKAVAQYPGTLGNELSVVVVRKSGTQLDVRTTLDGSIVDSQIVNTWAQYQDNDWIRLEGLRDGTPEVADPINLSGGEDGETTVPEVIMSGEFTSGAVKLRYGFAVDDDSNVNVDGVTFDVTDTSVVVKYLGQILAEVDRTDRTPLSLTFPLPIRLNDGTAVTISLKLFVDGEDVKTYAEGLGLTELEFLATVPLDEVTDIPLEGGNHGKPAPYGDLLNALRFESWNVLVSDDQSGTSHHYLHDYVNGLRTDCGLYRRIVLCRVPEDAFSGENEFNSDFCTIIPQVWRDDKGFTAFVRGAMACKAFNVSGTYDEVPIDEDPTPMFTDKEIEALLVSGYSPISKRDDGVLVVEKDINSFHEYENPLYYPLTKNRVLKTIDYFCTRVRYDWELDFCGKVTNDAIGRDMWKAQVIKILKDFQTNRAISEFVDPIVLRGNKVDEVITRTGFRVLDAMEICYFDITLNS